MLEFGTNIRYTIHSERPGLDEYEREVYFPALYTLRDDFHWWMTEFDAVGSVLAEGHYTFYTHNTVEQVLCHKSSARDFVLSIFDKEADVWVDV